MKGIKFRMADNSKFCVKDRNGNLSDIIPSNTIFSSLINNIDVAYGGETVDKVIDIFKGDEFSISSMFLGLDFYNLESGELEKSIFFLPRPEALIEQSVENDSIQKEIQIINRKIAKGMEMLSIGALKEVGKAWDQEKRKFDFNLLGLNLIGTRLACTDEEIGDIKIKNQKNLSFYEVVSMPHVQINRPKDLSSDFYYEDEKRYKYAYTPEYRIEPFMYFAYRGSLIREIKTAVNLMVDEGIGGKRSVGMGTFLSCEYVDINIPDNKEAEVFMNLSAYIPMENEYNHILGYKLDRADGYMYYKGGQPFRKRAIGTIKEGAISNSRIFGQLVDVTPLNVDLANKAYYNGRAFAIGLGGEING